MLPKYVKIESFIIEAINYELMKNRRKIFFSPLPNDSLLKILLIIISSLSYYIGILANLFSRNLNLKLF